MIDPSIWAFQKETDTVLKNWNRTINMSFVEDYPDWAELDAELPCGDGWIPSGFQWNGASVGLLRHIPFLGFPKWKHPIATCRHDFRCQHAKTWMDRRISDNLFWYDVALGGTRWEQIKGYAGVTLGTSWSSLKKIILNLF